MGLNGPRQAVLLTREERNKGLREFHEQDAGGMCCYLEGSVRDEGAEAARWEKRQYRIERPPTCLAAIEEQQALCFCFFVGDSNFVATDC